MSTNFPTALDSLTNPTSTSFQSSPGHASQHSSANDALEAIEAKVGVDSSAVTTSHDYKLSGVTGSDKAASVAGTETLTNKTIDATQLVDASCVSRKMKPTILTDNITTDFTTTTVSSYVDTGLNIAYTAEQIPVDGIVRVQAYIEVLNSADQKCLAGIGIGDGVTTSAPLYWCLFQPKAANTPFAVSPIAFANVTAGNTVDVRLFVFQYSAGTLTVKGAADRSLMIAEYYAR